MPSGTHKPASPKDRALGAELRKLRNAAGLSLAAVCEVIDWKESTLSRVERGLRSLSPETVMALALIYKIPHKQRERLVAWSKETPSLGWWDRPPADMPPELGALAAYELEATQRFDWSPGIVPGLLQVPAYTEAVMREAGIAEKDMSVRLEARRARQQMLIGSQAPYAALIDLGSLRNQLCSREDFVAQLRHLTRLSQSPNISLRLVVRPTIQMMSAWYLLRFAYVGPMVHIEHFQSATYLFDGEAAPYIELKRFLEQLALSEQDTRDMLNSEIEHVLGG
ncbi:helix-turn-helix domain-containing protein [Actinokineospora terrae]|uniref:Helix-turn-helix domain-containing protein n=1 Tax=Actinokineospora terrae TaxID=155974 RepID=A0A1H9WDE7_9PSEU|nr:helix-turn-helix transcriptional regulator [Actinokineospora terrae]SES31942.1 Helix-turn-helix domain-containing protein [Actinokineospora terrae]